LRVPSEFVTMPYKVRIENHVFPTPSILVLDNHFACKKKRLRAHVKNYYVKIGRVKKRNNPLRGRSGRTKRAQMDPEPHTVLFMQHSCEDLVIQMRTAYARLYAETASDYSGSESGFIRHAHAPFSADTEPRQGIRAVK
jgi:hypothetical protein